MKNQPLAWCGFSLLAGLLLASWACGLNGGMVILVVAGILLTLFAVGFALWSHTPQKKTVITVLFAIAFAFIALPVWELLAYQPVVKLDGQSVYIQGEIIDQPEKNGNRFTFTLQTETIDAENAPHHIKIRVTAYQYVQAFDKIEGRFKLSLPEISRGFNAKSYYKAKGIYLAAYGDGEFQRTESTGFSLSHLPLQIRMASLSLIDTTFQPAEAALVKGILLGDTSDIPQDTKENFQNAGLAHILAVSGTHTVILAQLLLGLLLWMRIKKRPACFIAAGFILLFMAITGFTPSVTRAGLMSILMLLGQGFYRQTSALNSLGFSLMVMFAVNPFAVTDIGLLLSFSATLGIIVLAPKAVPLQTKLAAKLPKPLQSTFTFFTTATLQSLFASLAVIPVSILAFSSLSVIAPLSNLAASVTFQPILVFGLLTLPIAALPFGHILAVPFAVVTALFTKLLAWLASFFGSLPFAVLPGGNEAVRYGLVTVFVFLLLMLLTSLLKKRKLLCSFAALFILLSGWTVDTLISQGATDVAVFADERGGSVIITSAGSTVVLQSGHDPALSRECSDYLQKRGIREIQLYIGTDKEYPLENNPLMTELVCLNAAVAGETKTDSTLVKQIAFDENPMTYRFDDNVSLTAVMRDDCYYVFLRQGNKTLLISDYPYLASFNADYLILPDAAMVPQLQLSSAIDTVIAADNGTPLQIIGHKVYPARPNDIITLRLKENDSLVIE